MAEKTELSGYRFYFDKNLEYLLNEELKIYDEYHAHRSANRRLRMYAGLFNRDIRKILLKPDSVCKYCGSPDKLEIDHITPITKGGKNEISNTQILCELCNIRKGARIG